MEVVTELINSGDEAASPDEQDRDNDDYYSKGYDRAWVRRICFQRGRERWIHHRWAQECQIRCHRAREGRIHHPWAQDVGSDGG
uniref:Uncharacterized protein n=1 Tax=Oryza sativa subsp. japonica TaxID=39947 RepID=Q6ZBI1_ORYSJ|nr:hypothetical protein [Oryza sativa Japonica Group]